MSAIPYRTVEISSDTAQSLIDQGHFNQQFTLNTLDTAQGQTLYVGGQIPIRAVDGSSELSYFRLEIGYRAQSFGGQVSWPILFTGWLPCGSGACESARRIVDEARSQTSIQDENLRSLPQGVTVTDVRYGDSNNDGLTDVLVRFSDGAAQLFLHDSHDLLRPREWSVGDVSNNDLDDPFEDTRAEKQTRPEARPPETDSHGRLQVRVVRAPSYYYRDRVMLAVDAERAGTLYVRAGMPPRVREFEVAAGANQIILVREGRDLVERSDGRIHRIRIEVSSDGQNFQAIDPVILVRSRRPR